MKLEAHQCTMIEQVRAEIDRIDRALVQALAQRMVYARRGAEVKLNAPVPPPAQSGQDRLAAMIAKRRAWATEDGLSPDLVEAIFRNMVAQYLVEEEKHLHR